LACEYGNAKAMATGEGYGFLIDLVMLIQKLKGVY
jgi:hypothetical protein